GDLLYLASVFVALGHSSAGQCPLPWISAGLIVSVGPAESKLYPFGEEVGDRMVKPDGADTNSPYISPPLGFPFFGKLFDRLYFSDNGFIQFQSAEENEQFLFPSAFPDGFRGNESIAMLAVFWDDADLTIGDGKLFYQEYQLQNLSDVYSQIVLNRTREDVTAFEQQRGRSQFAPFWILKITWDRVSPVSYQKINLSETNTFQCVLTTDGERSFALLHFAEMSWGPGQRLNHAALTGYTDGKKNFHNERIAPSQNLFGPRGRYRPHEVTGNAGVSPCPCTLAQALEDLAFGPETLPPQQEERVQELRNLRWGGATGQVFRSILANAHGSGKRCMYDPQGPLLRGYGDRYFTVATAQDHIEKDLLPFQWCCVQSPLCHLYPLKRPLDRCQGYGWTNSENLQLPAKAAQGTGMVYGSLHFITFDGTKYTFKALGEFVVARLSSPSGSNTFTLQAEMRQLEVDGRLTGVSAVSRLAAFHQGIGKVEWQHAQSGDGLAVLVDDLEVPVKVGVVYMGKTGFAVRCVSLEQCAAVYAGGLHVVVWRGAAGTLGTMLEVPQRFFRRTVGLLGLWSSDPTDDFLLSSGRTLPWPQNGLSGEETLQQFGLSWAVPIPESLLHSAAPTSQFQPITAAELMSVSPEHVQFLRKECQENLQCVHDILATNSTSLGLQSVVNEDRYRNLALTFGDMPPIVTTPTVIQCRVNVTARVQFIAQDPNNDSVSFSLLFPRPPLASIGSGNGVVTWTPLNIQPVVLTVMVMDKQLSSLLSPVIQICNCLNGGTCQYTSIVENHLQGKFQVVGCLCPKGFGGRFCGDATDACRGRPCFPGVSCQSQRDNFTCGQCPPHTVHHGKPGYKCFENDFCLPPFPFPCHNMAQCYNAGYSFTCMCKSGFTGDGRNCTDIDECMNPSACPNAKFECVNTPGSVRCSCRYKNIKESDGCGDSDNPPGWNIFNVSVEWSTQGSGMSELQKLQQILSMGFQNKFYNASVTWTGQGGQTSSEYRINVSSDTPHWYVQDYLTRVSQHYGIKSTDVGGTLSKTTSHVCLRKLLDQGILDTETACPPQTWTSVRRRRLCVTRQQRVPTPMEAKGEENRTGVHEVQNQENQRSLILGLVLGIGIPFLLLLLLAVLACFCCTRRKTITGEIPHCVPEYMQQQYKPPPFNYSDPALHYRTHSSPRFVDEITVRRYLQ
ncbi:hypothetical protein Z043_101243, partial [Scleropages formosus]